MPAFLNNLVVAFIVAYALLLIVEVAFLGERARLRLEVPLILALVFLLYATTGFPFPSKRVAFGGPSPLVTIGLMFLCVVLGIAARYLFFLKGRMSWRAFLKPLCVSPIILLPLIGSIQVSAPLESVQVVSLAILAFQNGFFWNLVLERAQPKT